MHSFQNLIHSWDNFFFKPRPVDSIALFRIIWMSLIFFGVLVEYYNIQDFYGPHAVASLKSVESEFNYPHLSIFQVFHPSYENLNLFFIIYLASLVFSIFGFYTRHAIVVVIICMTSLHQRNIWLLSSSELLMRITTIMLVFSPCAHAYSIDSALGKFKNYPDAGREWSSWVLRLIQIQLSVVYVWTVWNKIKGDTWFDGTAVYYATRLESMWNFPVPFLLDWLPFIKAATWGTLIIELGLGILIWFKEFQKPLIFIGIIFHLGIEYMMSIPFFEIVMILLLMLFIPSEDVKVFVQSLKFRLNGAKWMKNIANLKKSGAS
jgi:hypothetical protein